MSADTEALVKALWNHIWIDGELDRLGDVVSDPFVRHTRDGTQTTTPEGYARHLESVRATIRATDVRFEHLMSIDDHVYARIVVTGVNLAAGDAVHLTWLAHYRVADGRIAEAWTMHQTDLDW